MSKSNLIVGNYYDVLCAIDFHMEEDGSRGMMSHITPLIDHKHEDMENGQFYEHYHIDTRFINSAGKVDIFCSSKSFMARDLRITVEETLYTRNMQLRCISDKFSAITNVVNIIKSKLKHPCISKGKCPHRGYDLTDIIPVNGIITCPLHGLQFWANTGEVIDDHQYMLGIKENHGTDILIMPWKE